MILVFLSQVILGGNFCQTIFWLILSQVILVSMLLSSQILIGGFVGSALSQVILSGMLLSSQLYIIYIYSCHRWFWVGFLLQVILSGTFVTGDSDWYSCLYSIIHCHKWFWLVLFSLMSYQFLVGGYHLVSDSSRYYFQTRFCRFGWKGCWILGKFCDWGEGCRQNSFSEKLGLLAQQGGGVWPKPKFLLKFSKTKFALVNG